MMAAFGIGGATLAFVSYEMSFLPSMYASSSFWTTSPTYFFLRVWHHDDGYSDRLVMGSTTYLARA
jgi:hypothetical protein